MYTKRKTRCGLTQLPTELLTDIFCRLPVKSILQLRSVCKTWYEILSDSTFISMHANRCAKKQLGFLAFDPRNRRIQRQDERRKFLEYLRFPKINGSSSKFEVIGSCNGLVCLRKKTNRKHRFPSTYLWNPWIRAYKKLPEITHPQYRRNASCISGFGYDSRTDDYKVFHTVLQKLNKKEKLVSDSDCVIINRLYSLKAASWKAIDDEHYDSSAYPCGTRGCRAYSDGAFYWIPISRLAFIMRFDFRDEKILKSKLPIGCEDVREKFIRIIQRGDKLVLYICEKVSGRGPACDFHSWTTSSTMKKQSSSDLITWDKQFSVRHPVAVDKFEHRTEIPKREMFYYSESMFSQQSWTRY